MTSFAIANMTTVTTVTTECPICAASICTAPSIVCPRCDVAVCTACAETYLLETDTPKCRFPECAAPWSRLFIDTLFRPKFVYGPLKRHHESVIFERERALLPATQRLVARDIMIDWHMDVARRSQTIAARDEELRVQLHDSVPAAGAEYSAKLRDLFNETLAEFSTTKQGIPVVRARRQGIEMSREIRAEYSQPDMLHYIEGAEIAMYIRPDDRMMATDSTATKPPIRWEEVSGSMTVSGIWYSGGDRSGDRSGAHFLSNIVATCVLLETDERLDYYVEWTRSERFVAKFANIHMPEWYVKMGRDMAAGRRLVREENPPIPAPDQTTDDMVHTTLSPQPNDSTVTPEEPPSNPHYYEYLQTVAAPNAAAISVKEGVERTQIIENLNPTASMCGKVLDWMFVCEIENMARRRPRDPTNHGAVIQQLCKSVDELDRRWIVRTHDTVDTEKIRINFLRNRITEKRFKQMVLVKHKRHELDTEISNVFVMVKQASVDIMYRYALEIRSGDAGSWTRPTEILLEMDRLHDHADAHLAVISRAFRSTKCIRIKDEWRRHCADR